MGHLFPHIQQLSFFRDLEWRWRRVICVIEHDQLCSRRTDDRMTGRAVLYLRALDRSRLDGDFGCLDNYFPRSTAAGTQDLWCNTL